MLPLWDRVDVGAMAMKGYSTFPKAPTLLESHHQICFVSYPGRSSGVGVLLLCREAVGVFHSLNRLGDFVLLCCCFLVNIDTASEVLSLVFMDVIIILLIIFHI